MTFCDAGSTKPALGAGGKRRRIALALWLSSLALAHEALADHADGLDHPHVHDYSSLTPHSGSRIDEGPDIARIRELEALLTAQPESASVAAEVARRYLELFRYDGDPGRVARAKEVLAPWDEEIDPPGRLALERAVLWQTEHRFAAALEALQRLVQREPRNTRAWLTLAAVSKELRLHAESRSACGQVLWLSGPLLGGACIASVWTDTGRAREAYSMLGGILKDRHGVIEVDVAVWLNSLAAEAADAMNRPALAEAHYAAGLEAAAHAGRPPEIYLLVEYADFLLEEERPQDALRLLSQSPRAASVTLRETDARRRATF